MMSPKTQSHSPHAISNRQAPPRSREQGSAFPIVILALALGAVFLASLGQRQTTKAKINSNLRESTTVDFLIASGVERLKSFFDDGTIYYFCEGNSPNESCGFRFAPGTPATIKGLLAGNQFILKQDNAEAHAASPLWASSFRVNGNGHVPAAALTAVTVSVDSIDRAHNWLYVTATVDSDDMKGVRRARLLMNYWRRCGLNADKTRSYIQWGAPSCAPSPNVSYGRTNAIDTSPANSYMEFRCANGVPVAMGDFGLKIANGDATGPLCGWTYGTCASLQRKNGGFTGDLDMGFFGGCTGGGQMQGISYLGTGGYPPVAQVKFIANTYPKHGNSDGRARLEADAACTCD